MKVRVTLLTENDKSISEIGENPEKKARAAWEFVCAFLNIQSNDDETISLENVEIFE